MLAATQHDVQVDHDYALLKRMGITTVRDAVRWHLIEREGMFDFSSLAPMVVAAERHGTQVMWTLLHYGVPDDVDFFSAEFPVRGSRASARKSRSSFGVIQSGSRSIRRLTRFLFLAGRPVRSDGSGHLRIGAGPN